MSSPQEIQRAKGAPPKAEIPAAIMELAERCQPELLAQAQAILPHREDAEDVVQETLVEAIHNAERLAQSRSPEAWLRAVNRCNALDKARGRRRDRSRLERKQNLIPERTFTTGGFSMLELRDAVSSALDGLPEELQTIIRLRYFQNRTCVQIAEELNLTLKVVGRRLLDASALLCAKLERQLGPAPSPLSESMAASKAAGENLDEDSPTGHP